MSDHAFVRVGPRHPNKCQHSEQCHYQAVQGARSCPLHGGCITEQSNDRAQLKQLILRGALAQRAGEVNSGGQLKQLNDEVVIAKVLLESLVNLIKTPTDVMIYSDKITNTLKTTQSLVESLQKLQERNKELLDRETLFKIAESILTVITQHVLDPDLQRKIGEEIYGCVITGLGGNLPEGTNSKQHPVCIPVGDTIPDDEP